MLEILSDGPFNTVQDLGRPSAVPWGVCAGGAMDRESLIRANILAGNTVGAAAMEIMFFPFKVRFLENCVFAVAGAPARATLDGTSFPPDWSMQAEAGQVLILQAPEKGVRSYLAVAGGIDVPVVLGGRGTDVKGGFGGFKGRGLQKGDRLPCGHAELHALPDGGVGLSGIAALPDKDNVVLGLIPGPEYEAFTQEAHSLLVTQHWTITPHANRVGFRLEGQSPLLTRQSLSLLSHGVLPGTVQVPPAGQPIIQMADANTCGGYPKIGIIAEPDLSVLAQMPPGSRIRFKLVTQEHALARMRARTEALQSLAEQVPAFKKHLLAS
ncbi:biotin-dependent carboxyltransferase family protein [Acetobacter sp. TBRC 12305]|uniref:Biotin-dependent carboxyltransferase family protein n=1 Tax=Acetobacter garciniae TaxID=2817435 RepID=A0A939HNU8_9PROT|nr:biotin-dependent carboxyltransferase family protein [Acetobacter garciniae]MBO1324436.1 biotin-dependent carboxyltransferase family protein [Acetobacter garciniae]MBX0344125.1 biotin-dependent carboxyltransferase family protein [Acetobacter garciniae]